MIFEKTVTGLKLGYKKNKLVLVQSEKLKLHPLLDQPIRATKIIYKSIPARRPSLNEWFQKHF